MSKFRHGVEEPIARGYAVTHPPGRVAMPVQDGWDQFVYAESGTLRVSTRQGSWTVPPHRALWLPARQDAVVTNRARTAVRVLYLAADLRAFEGEATVLNVPRFARELTLHAVSMCPLHRHRPVDDALLLVLIDQLRQLPTAPLWLPAPTDPRALDFIALAEADPSAPTTDLARRAGAGVRTLERLFRDQTRLSLGAWRRRAAVLRSLEDLAAGSTVTTAAARAGYSSPSSYAAAFQAELGESPRTFIKA